MKKINILSIVVSLVFITSCNQMKEEEIAEIGIKPCRNLAPFIKQLGFNPSTSAFSTTEAKMKGVVLIQFPQNANDTTRKMYQDSSWKQFGYMGSLTTDDNGNAYTAGIPMVNTLDLPFKEMNKVYKIDANTGKMNVFCTLPKPDSAEGTVPFAILGVYFDCHAKVLYVSSVAGSTRDEEKGIIYAIDIATAKVIDELNGNDAMGLFVGGINNEKRLFFGSARKPIIHSIELTKDGSFKNKNIKQELSLDNLGPRGSDKARRIRYDKAGNLIIYGIEFNYSLAAQSNKPETGYQFNFDENEKKWSFYKIL
jgi:hypothetical protein